MRKILQVIFDSLTLILITTKDSKSDVHSEYLLTLIFNAMVLFLGLQNLFNFDNVESLKRNLRSCYSLIDELLCNQTMMCSLTQSVELIIDEDIKDLENGLISFGEAIQSDYANISVKNQIVNATESWWNLDPVELILLSILPLSLPLTQCADIPVYLPIASNQVPHRLLVLRLCDGVYLNCLCDTEPSLSITQSLALETFSPLRNKIMSLLPSIPRCLPSTIDLNHNVIAFCLVNIIKHQSVVSLPTPKTAERNFILSKGTVHCNYLCFFPCN
jgi:DNA topoisomerase 2-associated protein PAT1